MTGVKQVGRTLGMLSVALVLAGCAGAEPQPGFLAGQVADFEPASSPEELAQWSDLVVTGTLADVIAGRSWGASEQDPALAKTITAVVEVSQTLAGELPEGSDGFVYVEMPSQSNVPADQYATHVPTGTEVVFHLNASASDKSLRKQIVDPNAGRPDGQPIFILTSPQGFLIGNASDLHEIPDYGAFSGSSLTEFFPDSYLYTGDPDLPVEPELPGDLE